MMRNMQIAKDNGRISVAEIRELLDLKDWVYRELATELSVHLTTVQKWLDGENIPSGPASKLMFSLLTEARKSV